MQLFRGVFKCITQLESLPGDNGPGFQFITQSHSRYF